MKEGPFEVVVPRWAQAVVLPVVILIVLLFLRVVSHAVFVFLMAALLSLLLNPVVAALQRLRIPRVVGVTLVYLSFIAILVALFLVAVPPLAGQVRGLFEKAPEWGDDLNSWMGSAESFLAAYDLNMDLQAELERVGDWVRGQASTVAGTVFNVGIGLAGGLTTLFLVVIISFYMLVDGSRIYRYLQRILPGDDARVGRYLLGMQRSFTRYVKGQFLLAVAVGLGAGVGVWMLGWEVVGIWPEGSQYVLLFAVWAGVTEVVPLVGPWLGALPPLVMALFHSPAAAIAVALVYLGVQQLENHILVPNIMGTTVGVHPLAVIFALLAGAQIGGILGMIAVLPLLAMLKHTIDFFDVRLSREPWLGDDGLAAFGVRRGDESGGSGGIEASTDTDQGTGVGADEAAGAAGAAGKPEAGREARPEADSGSADGWGAGGDRAAD